MSRRHTENLSTHGRTFVVLAVALLIGFSLPAAEGLATTGTHARSTPLPAISWGVSAAGSVHPAYPSVLNESTLILFNNSIQPGDFLSAGSDLPSLEVFDPQTDEVFVEGFSSGIMDVVSGQSNEVVATIDAGEHADALAYDSQNNNIYFGLQTADLVGTVNASTDLLQGTVHIGFEPGAMAADPVTGNLFVTGWNSTGTAYVAVISGANGTVLTTFPLGSGRFPLAGPNGIAYDPVSGNFYIPSIVSGLPQGTRGNLTVVNGSAPAVLTNLSLTFNPDSILYVPSTGNFYLGNESGDNLSIFNPTSVSVVGVVALPNTPSLLASAAPQQQVYVGIDGNVSVVSTRTNLVVSTFPVTRQPTGLAYDPLANDLFISDYVGNNVSVVNATSYQVVTSILLGASPYNMAFDSSNGDLYVADLLSSQLIVVNGTTDRVTGFVPLGTTPYGVAYDPATQDLYVDDYYAGNVSVVSTVTNSVIGYLPAGVEPWGIAYDGANHDIYVTNPGSDNITILDPLDGTVAGSINLTTPPGAIAYDPVSSRLFVGDYDAGNVSVFNATTNVFLRNATVGSDPYHISVDPGTGDAFVGNYESNNVTELGPKGQELGSNITAGVGVFGSTYNPRDGNLYVVSFSSDLVTVINASSGSVIGGYQVGNGPVAAATDAASGTVFVANYDSGSLTLLSPTRLVQSYNVTFTETGLPVNSSWSVRLDGVGRSSTTDTIGYAETNGSSQPYSVGVVHGYVATPEFGLAVVSGTAVTIPIVFRALGGPTEYTVTFTESGLPSGSTWGVDFNGTTTGSSTSSIVFSALNGTGYSYRVTAGPTGYDATPSQGTLDVSGANVVQTVDWRVHTSPELYAVTFTETGLAFGTSWAVTLNGSMRGTATSTISFQEPNGSFAFTVGNVSGFTANRASGTLQVDGSNSSITIAFSPSSPATSTPGTAETPTFLGLPYYEGVALAGVLVVVVLLTLVVTLLVGRKGPKHPGSNNSR
ncbi:MAG: YncE family protein [Thermoplasmata archaeon]